MKKWECYESLGAYADSFILRALMLAKFKKCSDSESVCIYVLENSTQLNLYVCKNIKN